MEEAVFYIGQGDPTDKHSQDSFGICSSLHTSQQFSVFKNADCPPKGAILTGLGRGERIFIASANKALITVYSWGKESPDQRIPIPEPLSCITIIHQLQSNPEKTCSFRTPWLLIGGSKNGKLYIWEIASGNLLCVKDAHYQEISVIKASSCGTYIVTGGLDARIAVWKTLDLISIYNKDEDDNNRILSIKPHYLITDNSLAVSDLVLSTTGVATDLKLYTASKDGTCRIYDIGTKTLLTTFVLPYPITSIAKDPVNRAVYVGLDNGTIRTIPLYYISNNKVLESVGGMERIITLDHDPELKQTFTQHQSHDNQSQVTSLAVSLDGTLLISGDSTGKVFASDIVTRQVIQSFKECNASISYIQVDSCPQNTLENSLMVEKTHRLIPNLKRVLADTNFADQTLYMEIPDKLQAKETFEDWLRQKEIEEFEFKNISQINSSVKVVDGSKCAELEAKLAKVSEAYTELREKHAELFEEHKKVLSKQL